MISFNVYDLQAYHLIGDMTSRKMIQSCLFGIFRSPPPLASLDILSQEIELFDSDLEIFRGAGGYLAVRPVKIFLCIQSPL
jgi:hypothetical protein